jgi:hypothetical protein
MGATPGCYRTVPGATPEAVGGSRQRPEGANHFKSAATAESYAARPGTRPGQDNDVGTVAAAYAQRCVVKQGLPFMILTQPTAFPYCHHMGTLYYGSNQITV